MGQSLEKGTSISHTAFMEQQDTKHHGIVVCTPTVYLLSQTFLSWPCDQLSQQWISLIFSSSSNKRSPYISFPIHYLNPVT